MSLYSTLKHGVYTVHDFPQLVPWYLRNKIRAAGVPRERRRPDGASGLPGGLTLKPTFACNLSCPMCSFAASGQTLVNARDVLPLETWAALVDDIAAFKPYLTVTGGEPLLYPEIGPLLLHIKRRGLFCTMTTNGTMLDRRAPEFMEDPPDAIVVSLDGPPAAHDAVRGAGAFARTEQGIAALQALKRERRIKRPFLVINCAITAYNYEQTPDLIPLAREMGADALNYQHQWSLTPRMADAHNQCYGSVHYISGERHGVVEHPVVDVPRVVETVRRIRRDAAIANGKMFLTMYPNLDDDEVARWYTDPHNWVRRATPTCAWINTDVLPNGDVDLCLGMICGNVTRERFRDIWNSPAARDHRRRLAQAGSFPICARCCAYFRRD